MRSTLFLLFLVLFVSCSSNDDSNASDLKADKNNACTTEKPLEVLWMQKLKDSLRCGESVCESSILRSTYEGKSVFYIAITDGLCNTQAHYFFYNCEGKMIKELTNEESVDYLNNYLDRETEILFSCNGRN